LALGATEYFHYDERGLLSEVIVNGITRAEYEYNALGRLVQQIDRNAAGAIVFDLCDPYGNAGSVQGSVRG